jgi:hypothetical protein
MVADGDRPTVLSVQKYESGPPVAESPDGQLVSPFHYHLFTDNLSLSLHLLFEKPRSLIIITQLQASTFMYYSYANKYLYLYSCMTLTNVRQVQE